jgi:hypothetical protein
MPMKKVAVVQSNYIPWKGYVRLPLWIGLETQQDYVIERCRNALGG